MKRSPMPPRKTALRRRRSLARSRPATGRGAAAITLLRTSAASPDAAEAVARILAGDITVAQAARDSGYDEALLDRLAWDAARTAVLIRDSFACVACGRRATEVQHRVARGMGGTADPVIAYGMANLVSMDRPCHRVAESRDEDSHGNGYWLWSWEDPAEVPVMLFSPGGSGATVRLLPEGGYGSPEPGETAA